MPLDFRVAVEEERVAVVAVCQHVYPIFDSLHQFVQVVQAVEHSHLVVVRSGLEADDEVIAGNHLGHHVGHLRRTQFREIGNQEFICRDVVRVVGVGEVEESACDGSRGRSGSCIRGRSSSRSRGGGGRRSLDGHNRHRDWVIDGELIVAEFNRDRIGSGEEENKDAAAVGINLGNR